jgi:hypothetical protein
MRMAKHRLTKEEQQKGVNAALASPRTPPQLKRGLRKRQEQLQPAQIGNSRSSSRRAQSGSARGSKANNSRSSKSRTPRRSSKA